MESGIHLSLNDNSMLLSNKNNNNEKISLHFVLPSGHFQNDVTADLSHAFELCETNGFHPEWITEEQCLAYLPSHHDVFIFDPFDGQGFLHMSKLSIARSGTKGSCIILGPRCILSCIEKEMPIPHVPHPIYTVAMSQLIITSTGFDSTTKRDIQDKIMLMSGGYLNAFHGHITHLVAATPLSQKYRVAVQQQVTVMALEWIYSVWDQSQHCNIHATDTQFAKFTFPIFRSLTITVSRISKNVKQRLQEIIVKNGGTYSGQLVQNVTTHLLIPESVGEKYSAACRWGIPCLLPEWILDSDAHGYLQDEHQYNVSSIHQNSTPDGSPDKNVRLNAPGVSVILSESQFKPVIQDTINSELDATNFEPVTVESWITEIELLDFKRVSSFGHFLNGCHIYLHAFPATVQEKLRRLLNITGAVWYRVIHESVSHIIVPESTTFQNIECVKWLLECCQKGTCVDEQLFLCNNNVKIISNQNSKKVKHSQSACLKPNENIESLDEELLNHYTNGLLFEGLTFIIGEIEEEGASEDAVTEMLEQHGGFVWSSSDYSNINADYFISTYISVSFVPSHHKVNLSWLEECLHLGNIIPLKYYHAPLQRCDQNIKPLINCCVVLTGFQGAERLFLIRVIQFLGAQYMDMLSKRTDKNKGLIAATHLVYAIPSGDKFDAARSWNLPTLEKEWLLACLQEKKRISQSLFIFDNKTNYGEKKDNSIIKNETNEIDNIPENILCMASEMPTPKIPYGCFNPSERSSPSPLTRKIQKALLDNQPDDPYEKFRSKETPLEEIFKKSWCGFKDHIKDYEITSCQPLHGITAFIYLPRDKEKQEKVANTLQKLGASLALRYGGGITHVICKDKSTAKVLHQARDAGAFLVSPDWVWKCEQLGEHVSEDLFPSTYNSKQILNIESSKIEKHSVTTENSVSQANEAVGFPSTSVTCISQQLENLLDATKRSASTLAYDSSEKQKSDCDHFSRPCKRLAMDSQTETETQDDDTPNCLITWDDPVRHQELQRISNHGNDLCKSLKSCILRCFAFASMKSEETRKHCIYSLRQLGANISDSQYFESNVTHMLTDQPLRSEKMLACIAAGHWLLLPKYVEACVETGEFIDENHYEWGSEHTKSYTNDLSVISKNVALSARRWRLRHLETNHGAFHQMMVFLHMNVPEKTESFRRLLEAGGARVMTTKQPDATVVTHLFHDKKKSIKGLNIEFLAENGVLCLDSLYISDFLLNEDLPDVINYMNPDYLTLYKKCN